MNMHIFNLKRFSTTRSVSREFYEHFIGATQMGSEVNSCSNVYYIKTGNIQCLFIYLINPNRQL